MSQDTFIPRTEQEQIETLHRMFEASMQYDERLRYPVVPAPVLRITEAGLVPGWVQRESTGAELRRLRHEHNRMCAEVCRGLRIAVVLLAVASLWAATLPAPGLAMILSVMALTCLPLYVLAQPAQTEVR